MRIAWIGKRSPFCGNVSYSRDITNALIHRGHEVLFVHFSEGEDTRDNDVTIPYLYKSQAYTIPTLGAGKKLKDALADWKPDLVHASLTLSPLDFSLPEICHDLDLPLVATFHPAFDRRPTFYGGSVFLLYQLYAPSLSDYDRIIIFSRLQQKLLEQVGVPGDRIRIIPNGVDPFRFEPGHSTFRQLNPCRMMFTFMGRIVPEKGIEELLKVFHLLKLPDAKLVVVGDGVQAKALKERYLSNPNILFTGFIADESVRIDILRGSDVYVLPSQIEGLSIGLLEAMSVGCAPLATDVGSDGEVVQGAGMVLDPTRVKSQLAYALQFLSDNPDVARRLGEKARDRVMSRYTLENNLFLLERLYQELKVPQYD